MSDLVVYECRKCATVSTVPAECMNCEASMEEVLYVELSEHATLRAELAAVTAERDELRQSNRVISHQLERRADGMDDATQLLRKEKWDAIEQLKQTQAQLAAARRELELTQKKLSRITNETSHPFGGSMSWRECIKCDNPYPEWTAMSSMTCPACKLAAAQSALEAEKQAHGETRRRKYNYIELANMHRRHSAKWQAIARCWYKRVNDIDGLLSELEKKNETLKWARYLIDATTPAPDAGQESE